MTAAMARPERPRSWWSPDGRLPQALSSGPGGLGADPTRLVWLTRLRWVAIVGQLAVVVPALRLGWLAPGLLTSYLSIVAGLAFLNFATGRWIVRDRNPGRDMVLVQLTFDVIALTSLLLLSGGAWNPLAPLVFVHAALGALLLSGPRSVAHLALLLFALASITLFPLLPPALEARPTPVSVVLPSQVLVAGVIWGFTRWLTGTLNEHRRLLLNLKGHQERGDRLRAAGALAAGVSHELATPLNTLRMRLARLGRSKVPEDDPDLVAARDAAAHCEDVLRKMVGRQLEPGELRMEPVDPVVLVRRICASWSTSSQGVDLRVGAPADAPVILPTLAFTQALLNLLDNAAEAMASLDPRARPVDVRVGVEAAMLRVAVADTGPGWPDVVRENLGQPFLTTKPDGHGLGLYNAHALAVALGGRLQLEDRPGGGAIAAFVVPLEAFAPGELP